MTDLIEQQLQTIYHDSKPDTAFTENLEQQLRTMHRQPVSLSSGMSRQTRRLATIAASLLIVVVLFTAVAPLRSFAQSLLDFFIIGDGYYVPGTEDTYADVISVESVAEAEVVAGIDALEWVDGGFNILHIGAAEGFITIAYERKNDRGVLMHVSKWHTGTRREQLPISPDTEIIDTTVNGQPAQFAAGYWFGADPEWYPEHYRNLRWQDDEFSYSLQVSSPFASTLEQVVAVAEALQ